MGRQAIWLLLGLLQYSWWLPDAWLARGYMVGSGPHDWLCMGCYCWLLALRIWLVVISLIARWSSRSAGLVVHWSSRSAGLVARWSSCGGLAVTCRHMPIISFVFNRRFGILGIVFKYNMFFQLGLLISYCLSGSPLRQ